eukprot:scaffold339613_cov122-Cyclotella_meneghiniana.AAC.1
MKLLLILPLLCHAGTNKTLAPTPGFERPNPQPTPDGSMSFEYIIVDGMELSGKSSKVGSSSSYALFSKSGKSGGHDGSSKG